jgi:hypothetical protein
MNKFEKLLSKGGDVYARRVEALSTQAEVAQQSIVNKLKQEKTKLELEIINLTDLSPESTDSLRPGTKNWDATAWAKNLQRAKQDLHTVNIQLEIAENTYKEYFTNVEPEDDPNEELE